MGKVRRIGGARALEWTAMVENVGWARSTMDVDVDDSVQLAGQRKAVVMLFVRTLKLPVVQASRRSPSPRPTPRYPRSPSSPASSPSSPTTLPLPRLASPRLSPVPHPHHPSPSFPARPPTPPLSPLTPSSPVPPRSLPSQSSPVEHAH
jgi:hypothetical protein